MRANSSPYCFKMEAAPAWVALVSVRALAQELMALGTVPIEAEGTQARADTRVENWR